MRSPIQSPEKEIRFTRARQAVPFWLVAAVLAAAAMTIGLCALYRETNPLLPHPLWALVPAAAALVALRMAIHLTTHAYLILSPLGVEIFPFFRPAAGMMLIAWQEISCAEVSEDLTRLTLHHNPEKTSGVHLSLRPIAAQQRPLLVSAMVRRVGPEKE